MKNTRKRLRWAVTTVLALTLLPVINLNVERLAERKGWDQILSARWDKVIAAMANVAENPFFLVVLGVALGGTIFMWIDYFLRHVERRQNGMSPPESLSPDQISDLVRQIYLVRETLAATGDDLTYEGFHEAAALSMKLMKLGIQAPFMPAIGNKIHYETFNDQFCKFLAAIEPSIRDGDLKAARHFAGSTIDVVYRNAADPERAPERSSAQSPIYEGAHEQLMLFVGQHVLRAVSALFGLQELAVRQVSPDNLISNFAVKGAKPRSFTEYYERLCGLANSPAEFIPLDEMMNCVKMVEINYHHLPIQIGLILKQNDVSVSDFINAHADAYNEWQAVHDAMVAAYEPIKKNPQLTDLFRPVRPSRWGPGTITEQ